MVGCTAVAACAIVSAATAPQAGVPSYQQNWIASTARVRGRSGANIVKSYAKRAGLDEKRLLGPSLRGARFEACSLHDRYQPLATKMLK